MSKLTDALSPLRKETLQGGVYQRLCDLILEGGIAPGESVTVASLAAAFDVSPMPVREALTRLQAAGALTVVSGRTVGVPRLNRERLDDLRDVRSEVEVIATKWATEKSDPAFIGRLAAIIERLHLAEAQSDTKMYLRANYDLHFEIYRQAGSPTLITIIQNLWLQISPFFQLLRESDNFHISNTHHDGLVDAIRTGNADAAAAALVKDINDAYEVLSTII